MTPQQLRNSILQMAIEGKLTRQLPEDGNATDLLKKIKAEKAKLIKEKKIKKEKLLPEIRDDEVPFEIPDNWCWVRLGDIVSVFGGKRIPVGRKLVDINTGHKYIRVSDMKNGSVMLENVKFIEDDVYEKIKKYTISSSDVYITVAGTIGQVGSIPNELDGANLTENADKLIIYSIRKRWLMFVLSSCLVQHQIKEATTKVGQPKLAIIRIQNLKVPLVPLKEQKRIVARLEEILPLVDAYEKAYNELQELNKTFPVKLKNSLLQMAIEGKLVEQRPEDGNAADLLKKIKAEKARLIKEKKLKKEKPLPEIRDDEIPFEIPDNWCWVRLGDLVLKDMGGGTPSKENPKFWNGTIPWMSVKDFSYVNNGVIDDTIDHITLEGVEGSSTNIIDPSAIVLCVRMGLGRYAKLSKPTAINQDLRAFWLSKNIDENYFLSFYSSISIEGTGTTVKGIKRNELLNLCCPLPPLGEQKRIVAKLEQLLPLCDELMKHG